MNKIRFQLPLYFIIILFGCMLNPATATYAQEKFTWTKLTTQAEFATGGYQSTAVYDSESDKVIYFSSEGMEHI